jgi:hypothetical protein
MTKEMRSWVASSGLIRWSGLAALLGGALWVPYGIFEMLEPWDADVVYRDDVGYSVITDTPLFVAYSLPGSLALLLTSLGLLGVLTLLGASAGRTGSISLVLTYAALALAALSLAGVIVLFDPLFTGGRIFGSLALGTATFLAGVNALRSRVASVWTVALLVLGLGGVFLLPLWPLVYAVMWLPEAAGAAFIALFGLGWMAVGFALWSKRGEPVRETARAR